MSKLTPIDDGQIGDLLAATGLCVVLLTSTWDGRGVILRSILGSLAGEYRSVNFFEADYELSPRLARMFNLLSPPGVLFVREGELLQRLTGPVSAARIADVIRTIT